MNGAVIGQAFAAALGMAVMAYVFSKLTKRGQAIAGALCVLFCIFAVVAAVDFMVQWLQLLTGLPEGHRNERAPLADVLPGPGRAD